VNGTQGSGGVNPGRGFSGIRLPRQGPRGHIGIMVTRRAVSLPGMVALLALLAPGMARAQGLHLIPGIPEIPDEDLADVAVAVVDRPDPVIYYNPARFQRYGPELSTFFLAHEYGHIALHHTRTGLDSLSDAGRDAALRGQELDADCYAAIAIGPEHRPAIEAAIRFFTRLGPFRFDAVHPTGNERVQRLVSCLPPPQGLGRLDRGGETGVETGPVSGEPRMVQVRFGVASLGQLESGRDVELWIDGRLRGRFSNRSTPTAVDLSDVSPGLHSYRVRVDVYSFDALSQFERAGSVEGRGHIALKDGDEFLVDWIPGSLPWLERAAPATLPGGC
jgi:hypothetical protein